MPGTSRGGTRKGRSRCRSHAHRSGGRPCHVRAGQGGRCGTPCARRHPAGASARCGAGSRRPGPQPARRVAGRRLCGLGAVGHTFRPECDAVGHGTCARLRPGHGSPGAVPPPGTGKRSSGPTTSVPCPGMFASPTSTQKGTATSTNSLPPLPRHGSRSSLSVPAVARPAPPLASSTSSSHPPPRRTVALRFDRGRRPGASTEGWLTLGNTAGHGGRSRPGQAPVRDA